MIYKRRKSLRDILIMLEISKRLHSGVSGDEKLKHYFCCGKKNRLVHGLELASKYFLGSAQHQCKMPIRH